ncbi:unnamed protein product [Rhizoctonia solani]|uniref:Uncharacterized protein n=1 Tax=Rhizoctonia solani TaxID=456999 RepID=A0A8H3A160_9AGAM|nr:unnamed protein product [Rhizoctonia solani]
MSIVTHQLETVHPPLHVRRGQFAYPREAVGRQEKRCLDSSRKEYIEDLAYDSLGNGCLRRHVSSDGRLYFGYEQFISPNNLGNRAVFSAFQIASQELSQLAAITMHSRFEVVISLQCISPAEPQFSYYFVDHDHHRVSDESILTEHQINTYSNDKRSIIGYWEHLALFSAHHLCTSVDYYFARGLLFGRRSQQLASLITRNDDTLGETEILCSLLSQFDPVRIDTHATASIARVMKWIMADPPAPKLRSTTWPGSTILRSLRGIILADPDDRHENEDCFDSDEETKIRGVHPLVHEDSSDDIALAKQA